MKSPWERSGANPNQDPLGVYFGQDGYRGHVMPRNEFPTLPFTLTPVGMPLVDPDEED
jgi:hypothetical protein